MTIPSRRDRGLLELRILSISSVSKRLSQFEGQDSFLKVPKRFFEYLDSSVKNPKILLKRLQWILKYSQSVESNLKLRYASITRRPNHDFLVENTGLIHSVISLISQISEWRCRGYSDPNIDYFIVNGLDDILEYSLVVPSDLESPEYAKIPQRIKDLIVYLVSLNSTKNLIIDSNMENYILNQISTIRSLLKVRCITGDMIIQ